MTKQHRGLGFHHIGGGALRPGSSEGWLKMSRHLLSLFLVGLAATTRAEGIAACADLAGMPPFVYTAGNGRPGLDAPVGVAVDLLQLVAKDRNWKLRIDMLPWGRCMRDAEDRRYAIVVNVVREEALASHLLLSRPFFRLHGVYLYSGRVRPGGMVARSMDDFLHFKVCGMAGHRFEAFGFDTRSVDRGTTKSFEQLIAKLHLGRCDVAIGTREEVAGIYLKNQRVSQQIADGSLRIERLPGAPEFSLHFAVPASLDDAGTLLKSLNDSLEHLERRGTVSKLIDRHLEAQEEEIRN